jgi:hypothetical protein
MAAKANSAGLDLAEWDNIIADVLRRVADPNRRVDMRLSEAVRIGVPFDISTLPAIEGLIGHPLPPPLIDLYQRVGNGGFGPGYGFMKLSVTDKRAFGGNILAVLNFLQNAVADDPENDDALPPSPAWPVGVVPLVYWGCTLYSLVDCNEPGFPVFQWDCDGPDSESDWPIRDQMKPTGLDFVVWLRNWAQDAAPSSP